MEFTPTSAMKKVTEERDQLAMLVDGAYTFIELYKPEEEYNQQWRKNWLERAKNLVPGCDSLDS